MCVTLVLLHSMTAAETTQIRTRASNRTFLLRGAYEADQDYPAHRLLSGAADLSLRTMPQRRNDRGEVKTKEIMKRRVPSWLINLAKPTPAPWTSISAIKQVTRDMARNRLRICAAAFTRCSNKDPLVIGSARGLTGHWSCSLWSILPRSRSNLIPQYRLRYATAFVLIEYVSLLVFTVEYGLRLWCAVEHGPYRHLRHSRARMKYALSPAGIIDLIAVLPFWFATLLPSDLRFVLVFRMVRFLRLRAIRRQCARCWTFFTTSGVDCLGVLSSRSAPRLSRLP